MTNILISTTVVIVYDNDCACNRGELGLHMTKIFRTYNAGMRFSSDHLSLQKTNQRTYISVKSFNVWQLTNVFTDEYALPIFLPGTFLYFSRRFKIRCQNICLLRFW